MTSGRPARVGYAAGPATRPEGVAVDGSREGVERGSAIPTYSGSEWARLRARRWPPRRPVTRLPPRVGDRVDHDALVTLELVEHQVREASQDDPPPGRRPTREPERMLADLDDRPVDGGQKLQSEAGATRLVSRGGFLDLGDGICVNDDGPAQVPLSLRSTWARTSAQGLASAVPVARRRFSSSSQAVSHSGSGHPSTLSISSAARASRSSSGRPRASMAMSRVVKLTTTVYPRTGPS